MKPHEVIKENLEEFEQEFKFISHTKLIAGEHLVSPYGNVLIKDYLKSSQLSLLLSVKEMVKAQIPDFETRFNMGYIQAIEKIQLLLDEEINKIKELN